MITNLERIRKGLPLYISKIGREKDVSESLIKIDGILYKVIRYSLVSSKSRGKWIVFSYLKVIPFVY